ncbi:MAG: hypothetical protein RL563_494 [Pseudomonadota bacterium]
MRQGGELVWRLFIGLWSIALLIGWSSSIAGEYHLVVGQQTVQLIDKPQQAIVANGHFPAPTLYWREGEEVTLKVTNTLQEPTSIHWHGIVLPYQMDGVPGISFDGIAPGETFTYRFQLKQSGTYWYHGHSGMQEQLGLLGAIVIEPAKETLKPDRDYTILLSDWPQADPHRSMVRLKAQSDYYNFQKRTLGDFFADIERLGWWETLSDRLLWGEMRMEPTDLSDITAANYRYLINGQTPQKPGRLLFNDSETVRLRFINASAMTHFDVRIPGLKMRVIAADGQMVEPLEVEEFRIAVAETYDVLVKPNPEQAYAIFAETLDRSGYAYASLTPRGDWLSEIPSLRPMTLLKVSDMGGAHSAHTGAEVPSAQDHSDHQGHAMLKEPSNESSSSLQLSYAQLQSIEPNHTLMGPPDREITLRLTGNMNRYIWSFDDIKYSDSEPIRVTFGERVRFHYVNQTMMNHPVHIHGLWQYLDNGNSMYNPKKHVINVKPGETVSVDVPMDAIGTWAFHCHLLYHMDTGMFRKLIVEPVHEP